MMVSERQRNGYAANYDYDALRNDRYSRYDYESVYEEQRSRTSDSYRDSLYNSLERPATRSRVERADENRYGFYMANIAEGENNYDKFWDARHKKDTEQGAPKSKKRLGFIVAYIVIAVVALIAVTLAVVGTNGKTVVVSKTIDSVTAGAEHDLTLGANGESAAEEEAKVELPGGENYIMLANGELFEIVAPERAAQAVEEENSFDKFCNLLNGMFGG